MAKIDAVTQCMPNLSGTEIGVCNNVQAGNPFAIGIVARTLQYAGCDGAIKCAEHIEEHPLRRTSGTEDPLSRDLADTGILPVRMRMQSVQPIGLTALMEIFKRQPLPLGRVVATHRRCTSER